MSFQPDYRYLLLAANNQKPQRLPLYEHIISPAIMEKVLNQSFAELFLGNDKDLEAFFTHYCRFFKEMTYDTVSFEICITEILPDHGAIMGGRPGPIQTRSDFERYPWDDLPQLYWQAADKKFAMLARCMPEGMKAVGGVGNGLFEISEDLVDYEYLGYMQTDDPKLFGDLYQKIGDVMAQIWDRFLRRYAETFCLCRFGDDLGFKTSTLASPA